ncbi:lipoprotein [Hydrogenimonas cancrithermarum]|uniref:Lipoprotein n=2 Tax=Hydrogenimonas cancrithermarum TaxID=2993563 RepID=A0ABM8FML5_9BACT|nr:lipoprotein [Hydrogenimonas cancrithermarum]
MRKRFARALALWTLPPLIWTLMWFLYLTARKRWHFKGEFPDSPVVIAFWHGELLMAPFIYAKLGTSRKLNIMISDHFDGEIVARLTRLLGMKTIRGSSRKGAVKALISAIKAVKEEGEHVGITPDGPRGPRHSVSDGAVVIAQKAGIPIVIVNVRPQTYWQAGSWDRFTVPKPFSAIDFYISEPIDVTGMDKGAAKKMLRERMLEHAVE